MSCKKHSNYLAKFPPNSSCVDCWLQYAEEQDMDWLELRLDFCTVKNREINNWEQTTKILREKL